MKWPYIVRIKPPEWIVLEPYLEGYRYVVQCKKNWGNCHSKTLFCRTPEEVKAAIRQMLTEWLQPDTFAPKTKRLPTPHNMIFHSFTQEIRKEDLIQQAEAHLK